MHGVLLQELGLEQLEPVGSQGGHTLVLPDQGIQPLLAKGAKLLVHVGMEVDQDLGVAPHGLRVAEGEGRNEVVEPGASFIGLLLSGFLSGVEPRRALETEAWDVEGDVGVRWHRWDTSTRLQTRGGRRQRCRARSRDRGSNLRPKVYRGCYCRRGSGGSTTILRGLVRVWDICRLLVVVPVGTGRAVRTAVPAGRGLGTAWSGRGCI